jgi:hypothetical protein
MRAYLLGQLPQSEREEIEMSAFQNEVFDSEVQEAEMDLLDDWARGRLSTADARIVVQRFPVEKRRAALLLAQKAQHRTQNRANVAPWWLAAAAAMILSLPAVYFWRQSRSLKVELESARLPRAETAAPAPEVATLALRNPSTRGAAAGPAFSIAPSAQFIRLTAGAVPEFPLYEIRIESSEKGLVFSQVAPLSSSEPTIEVPSQILGDGNYDVMVFGRKGDSSELLASYPVRILRR